MIMMMMMMMLVMMNIMMTTERENNMIMNRVVVYEALPGCGEIDNDRNALYVTWPDNGAKEVRLSFCVKVKGLAIGGNLWCMTCSELKLGVDSQVQWHPENALPTKISGLPNDTEEMLSQLHSVFLVGFCFLGPSPRNFRARGNGVENWLRSTGLKFSGSRQEAPCKSASSKPPSSLQ